MLDVKKFKDTETRKFFVSNTLKLKRTTTTCVIIEDSLGQEWEVYKDEFLSFIIKNNITIKDNILDEYLIIDRKGDLFKAEVYDNWLIKINSITSFDKNDLKIGQSYILGNGLKVIYLGEYYQGKYSFNPNRVECFSYSNIYKKSIFIKDDRLIINSFYKDSFVYNVSNNIISEGEEESILDNRINEIITILKETDYYFYFSTKKPDGNRRKIKLKKISAEYILNIKQIAYCNYKSIFKMYNSDPNLIFFIEFVDFVGRDLISKIDYVFKNLKVQYVLNKETLQKEDIDNIIGLNEKPSSDNIYVIDLD